MSEYLKSLKTNPKNPRTITKQAFEELKDKLRRVPQGLDANKIVFKDGVIMAGNQRFKALQELAKEGFTVKDDYFVDATNWTDEQIREYVITSNVSDGEWDWDILANEWSVDDLDRWGLALPEDWLDKNGEVTEDEAPEVDDKKPPESKLGEVYKLGRHRLMCGDATKRDDVAKLMDGELADMLLTDPPYGVDYVSKNNTVNYKNNKNLIKNNIENDVVSEQNLGLFLGDVFSITADFMKSGSPYYVWHTSSRISAFLNSLSENIGKIRQTLIWVKDRMVFGMQDYHWQHEPCLYGWKDGASHYFTDDRTNTTVYEDDELDLKKMSKNEAVTLLKNILQKTKHSTVIHEQRPTRSEEHPTMKPIRLMAKLILNSSRPDELVLDVFGGSGSTLIACEQTERNCYMLELDPKYCDVIRKRYHRFVTGDEKGWQNGTKAV